MFGFPLLGISISSKVGIGWQCTGLRGKECGVTFPIHRRRVSLLLPRIRMVPCFWQSLARSVSGSTLKTSSFALEVASFSFKNFLLVGLSSYISLSPPATHCDSFHFLLCSFCPITVVLDSLTHVLEPCITFVFQFPWKYISIFFCSSTCFCTFSGEGGKLWLVKPTSSQKSSEALT